MKSWTVSPQVLLQHVSSYYCSICVLILLLFMCPHTTAIYESSHYCYVYVRMLLLYKWPRILLKSWTFSPLEEAAIVRAKIRQIFTEKYLKTKPFFYFSELKRISGGGSHNTCQNQTCPSCGRKSSSSRQLPRRRGSSTKSRRRSRRRRRRE